MTRPPPPPPREVLPAVADPAAFEAIRRDETRLRPGVEAICARHGLDARGARRFPDGSVPVYEIGGTRVLKLFPPFDLEERDRESLMLEILDERLRVPTPARLASGEIEGWGYLLMDCLRGVSLASSWPHMSMDDRRAIVRQLGEALAGLHGIRDPRTRELGGDWSSFLETQRRTSVDRQKARGLDARWLEQIEPFLDSVALEGSDTECLLHTEIMREHLLIEREGASWRISGLFDFEPAMQGAAEYEFAAAGLFVTCGDPQLLRELLVAYGYSETRLGPPLQRRILAYALLHRYSNMVWYLERIPPPKTLTSLDDLAAYWWRI